MFDDYALPSNYGYGDGDASQLGDLARADAVAGVEGNGFGAVAAKDVTPRTMPERPRMRVVPNEWEQSPPAPAIAHPIIIDDPEGMRAYGYGATRDPYEMAAETAAQTAKSKQKVTPQSPAASIKEVQINLVNKKLPVGARGPDGDWGPSTRDSLYKLQARNGLPQQDIVDGPVWALLLSANDYESKALSAFNKSGASGDKFFSASGLTAGLEGLLSVIKPPAPGQQYQPGAQQQVSGGGTQQQEAGSDWKTYALIGGGVLLVGGLLYFAFRDKGE